MRAEEMHSLTAIAVAGRKTMVRSDRLFMAEESRLVSRAICCCMRLYNYQQTSRFSSSRSHNGNCV
jgi:hypothetical protein